MIFTFTISNYNDTQITEYEEVTSESGTLGFLAAEEHAMIKFREDWPENQDDVKYLKIKSHLSIKKK